MTPTFIGIAGGSGVGKSTLSFALQDKYSDNISVLHFDDYQKSKDLVPRSGEWANWDHPDTIDTERLLRDLVALRNGQAIVVETMDARDNPHYGETRKRLPVKIEPREYIVVEGYLSLHHPHVRDFFDLMIYLDLHQDARVARRTKKKGDYVDQVLIPMHNAFVEPTKKFAQIIDVSQKNPGEVLEQVEKMIFSSRRATLQ